MENREVLLVYASEEALKERLADIPQALAVSFPVRLGRGAGLQY